MNVTSSQQPTVQGGQGVSVNPLNTLVGMTMGSATSWRRLNPPNPYKYSPGNET